MKPTFTIERGEEHITFYAYCGSPTEATSVRKDIQSLCGSHVEQDEDMIYILVDLDRCDESITELEKDGYSTEDEFDQEEDTLGD